MLILALIMEDKHKHTFMQYNFINFENHCYPHFCIQDSTILQQSIPTHIRKYSGIIHFNRFTSVFVC